MLETKILVVNKEDLLAMMEEVVKKNFQIGRPLSVIGTEEEEFCDIDEAARITNRKKSTIYKLKGENKIPHYKKGGKLSFKRSELMKWIEKGNPRSESLNNLDEYLMYNRI